MDKIEFRKMLADIVDLAAENDNQITTKQVDGYLKGSDLDSEQLNLVYNYLEANKITVIGHVKVEQNIFEQTEELENDDAYRQLEAEERQYIDMYLNELEALDTADGEEIEDIYKKAIAKDAAAKSRLIELWLLRVAKLAEKYVNRGVLLADLIQEGNIGLMLSVDSLESCGDMAEAENYITGEITASMENAIEEVIGVKKADINMLGKVNFLNEGAKNLEEELGRRGSIKELSKYMEMTEDEVMDIIRISDDKIKVKENEKEQ